MNESLDTLIEEIISLQKEKNILKRYPRIEKAVPLLERKIFLEKEWVKKEASNIAFPASKYKEEKGAFGLEIFSLRAVLVLAICISALFPVPFLAIPIVKMYKRRREIKEELKDIEKSLRCILPAKFSEAKGDFLPKKYNYLKPLLLEEGILFEDVNKDFLKTL